ncbi:MAG TPA: histidine kinase [Chthoniobacteraceae bacterium]|nr:histidine kinase [Chthoniobacteraceae bacterium]
MRKPPFKFPQQPWLRLLLFSLLSNAAILFTSLFGLHLWPERLPVNSQNVFWLASGVNVGGLLLLGLRYWPVLLLNAFPIAWVVGEPLEFCLLGACANALEALFGAWLIGKAGRFTTRFDSLRSVGALVVASLLAPLINTLLIPAYLCATGQYAWGEYVQALGNWNLSNGTAILLLTPLLVSVVRRDWTPLPPTGRAVSERGVVLLATAALSFLAFDALFSGRGMNLAFLAFPPILYAAVRFGIGETSLSLAVVLASIDAALLLHGRHHPVEAMPALLWFTQAITWVLAATGLLVAALGSERRRAERRSLEASLAAEQARLSALCYQINPHFLFNTLNSIRAALPLQEKTAREMITSLSDYLRSTLEEGDRTWCLLRDELHHLRDYLRIEQHRFGSDLAVHFEIGPGTEQIRLPTFLLQPLVENAIRHGLEKNPGPCHITLCAARADQALHLCVSNTGAWQPPGSGSGTGTGLRNLQHRLRLCYGPAATLEIDKPPGAVQISVILPV